MTIRSEGIRAARSKARALGRRFGVTAPEHVRVEAIAAKLGVQLQRARLDGATAQLVRNGATAHILISNREMDAGALRFSIAHELGHFVLEHPSCAPSELLAPAARVPDATARDFEIEANAFAAELLMPRELVALYVATPRVSLAPAWAIARAFNVSILASSRRFAELSPKRCAAVFSTAGEVAWVEPSTTFATLIRRGQRLAPRSIAHEFFARGEIASGPRTLPGDAWLGNAEREVVVEDAIASRDFGTVLSMVWLPGSSTK